MVLTHRDMQSLRTEGTLRQVASERARQRKHWSTAHDAQHTPDEWRGLILQRAVKDGPVFDQAFRRDLVEIAALAVAALESQGVDRDADEHAAAEATEGEDA